MTPVGDYLKKLLYQYDCLVVPELGAFLTHYRPASYNDATGTYLPPRKQLAFNEALRLDDGILINYLMLHESINRDGAMRQIGQFVAEIRQQIRQSGSITLDGIGLLTLNEEGKLQFDPALRHNFFAESFGLQPILAVPCARKELSLPVSVLPVSTTSLALSHAMVDGEGQLMPLPVSRRSPWYWAAATVLVGSLAALSYVSVVDPNGALQSSLSPGSLLRMPAFIPAETPLPATPAPIAKTVTAAPAVVVAKPAAPAVAVPTVPAAIPAPATGTVTRVPATVSPATVCVVPKTVASPKKVAAAASVKPFLVVAGSFSSRGNAVRLRKKLIRAGFGETFLLMPTRRKDLIKVAAYGATDLTEADTVMAKVTALTGAPAWLMRTR